MRCTEVEVAGAFKCVLKLDDDQSLVVLPDALLDDCTIFFRFLSMLTEIRTRSTLDAHGPTIVDPVFIKTVSK